LANNLRDIDTDATTGKRTLAVRVGRRRAGFLYVGSVLVPFAGVLVWGVVSISGAVASVRPGIAFLPWRPCPWRRRRSAWSRAKPPVGPFCLSWPPPDDCS